MTKTQLTIVIPVYNRARIVKATLDSIEAQTLRPLEVVIVDNNSTDGTAEVLTSWAERVRTDDFKVTVISEIKKGPGAARNAGLKAVTTPWTMFFDSDDLMTPDHCFRAMATVEQYPQSDIVGWDIVMPAADGRRRYRPFVTRDMMRTNIFDSIFSTLHYMGRTDLFRRAGGWLESAEMGEDVELGHRILLLNPICVRMRGKGETVEVTVSKSSLMHDGTNRLSRLFPAFEAIRENLPQQSRHLIDLKYISEACGWAKNDPEQRSIVNQIISKQSLRRKILFRLFYIYGRAGGRGIGRIYRFFSSQKQA